MGNIRSKRQISLSSEFHILARSIDGMRIMTEKWRDNHFSHEELPRLADALHSTLILVRERLSLLDCVVRDTLDAKYAYHKENQAFAEEPGDDGDVVLRSWSARKAAEKLRGEAERAAHHAQVVEERRKRRQQDGG